MPLYEIEDANARWHTIVVRAADEAEACEVGERLRRQYIDPHEPVAVTAKLLDPDGPPAVLIDDPS